MQTSPDSLTTLIALIQARGHSEPVPRPKHPALQQSVEEIETTLHTKGPTAAAEFCGEALIAISGLLGMAEQRDPITLVVLANSNLSTEDLTQFGLWLDQRSEELTKKLS